MQSKYLRLRVPEGEGSEVIEYESKEPYFGWYSKNKLSIPGIGSSVAACSIDNDIYILGVSDKSKTVYKYDTITNTYSNLAEMLYAKFIPTISVIDGMIYISGGRGDNSYVPVEYAPVILKYNPATNLWYDIGRTIERRMFASSFVINGKIYICGGQTYPNNGNYSNSSLTNLNSVEVFDLETGASAYVKSLPFNLYMGTSYIKNNKAYLFGGISEVNAYLSGATTKVIEYDPNLGELIVSSVSFSENIDIIDIREKTIPPGSITFNINGNWYMCGGDSNTLYLKKYNSINKIWEVKTSMLSRAHTDVTCVVVGNIVYVANGFEYIQYYDSMTDTWSKTIIPFITPGSIYASSKNPICYMQGYLYVVIKFSIYKYDIANNIWSTAYTMAEDRSGASYFTSGDDIYICGAHNLPMDKYFVKYNTVTSKLTALPTVFIMHIFTYEDNVYAIREYDLNICMYDISTNNWVKKGYITENIRTVTIHTYDAGLHVIYYKDGVRYATRMDINRIPCGVWQEIIPMRIPRTLPGIIEQENALLLVGGSNYGYNVASVESYNMDTPETAEPMKIKYETSQSYNSVLVPVNGKNYTIGGSTDITVRLLEYKPKALSFVKKKFYKHIHKKPELDVALIDSTYIPKPGEVGEGFVSDYYPVYYNHYPGLPLFGGNIFYGFIIDDKSYLFGMAPGDITYPRKIVVDLKDMSYTITDYPDYEDTNDIPHISTTTKCGLSAFTVNGKGYFCNGKLYFDQGHTSVPRATLMYDPVLDKWIRVADAPTSRSEAVSAVDENGSVYIIGGVGKPTTIDVYDPISDEFIIADGIKIPTNARLGSAIYHRGYVYILSDYNYNYHPYVCRFDPNTYTISLTSKRKINTYFDYSISFILQDKIVVTGGYYLSRTVEVFDDLANVWSMSGDKGIPKLEGSGVRNNYLVSGVYNGIAYIFHPDGCSILKPSDFIKKINMTEIIENDDTDISDCIMAVRVSSPTMS